MEYNILMHFKNRTEAGKLLAQKLTKYRNEAIVFALPRGGVVLGAEVARKLNIPMNLIITRKIGHPKQEEYSIAAVSESGKIAANEKELLEIDTEWFKKKVKEAVEEIKRRKKLYITGHKEQDIKKKIVIVVDDGVATGFTMKAAVEELQLKKPKEIIVASPVIFPRALHLLRNTGVKITALDTSDELYSISSYYDNFPQVSDKEVIKIMNSIS